jgi:hypothetical protein
VTLPADGPDMLCSFDAFSQPNPGFFGGGASIIKKKIDADCDQVNTIGSRTRRSGQLIGPSLIFVILIRLFHVDMAMGV